MMQGFFGTGMLGGFGMLFGSVFWLLVLALVIWSLYTLLGRGMREPETPLAVLKGRYAAGEISQAEFEQARRAVL